MLGSPGTYDYHRIVQSSIATCPDLLTMVYLLNKEINGGPLSNVSCQSWKIIVGWEFEDLKHVFEGHLVPSAKGAMESLSDEPPLHLYSSTCLTGFFIIYQEKKWLFTQRA